MYRSNFNFCEKPKKQKPMSKNEYRYFVPGTTKQMYKIDVPELKKYQVISILIYSEMKD